MACESILLVLLITWAVLNVAGFVLLWFFEGKRR